MKGNNRKFFIAGAGLAAIYGVLKIVAKRKEEPVNIDKDNPYLDGAFIKSKSGSEIVSVYVKFVKPAMDQILSFIALLVLSPIFGIIALAVYLDDPGQILFKQKRVGKDGHFFELHKFRTMKIETPDAIPTHQLVDPERYLTRVGRVLRKTSLDELPQIWDIFRGKMSMIGPRPALWNQKDLIAEREKYCANCVLPGLSGWAQINGRDELEIDKKAKLDGQYTKRLKIGGRKAVFGDMICFFGTVYSVLHHDGVVEGGTGELARIQKFSVNQVYKFSIPPLREDGLFNNSCVKVLIVGAGSYIGMNTEKWLLSHGKYEVDTFDILKTSPTIAAFIGYDVVVHVAGIVHCKEKKDNIRSYYEVNRDLAVKVARIAKISGVKQFIILSSMSVYGISAGVISKDTKANPKSNYGKSKLQADEKIWKLRDQNFRVTILRPPMVYGKDCKGNYQPLRKLSLITPFFPKVNNQRSMIYIGNLCSFIQNVIDYQKEGIFFPQNSEYVNISDLVGRIAITNGKRVREIKLFNSNINMYHINLISKVFGSLVYKDGDLINTYRFDDSISLTENQMV